MLYEYLNSFSLVPQYFGVAMDSSNAFPSFRRLICALHHHIAGRPCSQSPYRRAESWRQPSRAGQVGFPGLAIL